MREICGHCQHGLELLWSDISLLHKFAEEVSAYLFWRKSYLLVALKLDKTESVLLFGNFVIYSTNLLLNFGRIKAAPDETLKATDSVRARSVLQLAFLSCTDDFPVVVVGYRRGRSQLATNLICYYACRVTHRVKFGHARVACAKVYS